MQCPKSQPPSSQVEEPAPEEEELLLLLHLPDVLLLLVLLPLQGLQGRDALAPEATLPPKLGPRGGRRGPLGRGRGKLGQQEKGLLGSLQISLVLGLLACKKCLVQMPVVPCKKV